MRTPWRLVRGQAEPSGAARGARGGQRCCELAADPPTLADSSAWPVAFRCNKGARTHVICPRSLSQCYAAQPRAPTCQLPAPLSAQQTRAQISADHRDWFLLASCYEVAMSARTRTVIARSMAAFESSLIIFWYLVLHSDAVDYTAAALMVHHSFSSRPAILQQTRPVLHLPQMCTFEGL